MNISRRQFGQRSLATVATLALAPSFLMLEGCSEQATIAALLNEAQNAWSALVGILGKVVPASLVTAFTDAINAVNNWKSGTPAQGVVQVLNILAADFKDIGSLIPGLPAIATAAASLVLGAISSIIVLLDPSAAPPTSVTAAVRTRVRVYSGTPKNIRKGFETDWAAFIADNPQFAGAKIK